MNDVSAGLPSTWREARFDQILTKVDRKFTLDDSASYDCVGVRWYGLGAFKRETLLGMQIKRKQQWVLRHGDVVYNKLFAWKGAFAVADAIVDGCIVSDKFPTYAIDPALIDAEYLSYYFQMPQLAQQAAVLSKGAAAISKLTLNPPQFWDLTIPLPPLDEQRRIVARIAAIAARIEEARGLRRAVMEDAEALERGNIDATLDQWFPMPGQATVEEVALSVTDGDHVPPPKADSGIPFILISNITTGKLDIANCRWVPEGYFSQLQEARVPRQGDVLYAAVGATYGTPCLVDTDRPFCFQRHIAIIRPDQSKILPRYLLWALRSGNTYRQATGFVTGSAQPTVPLRGIRKLRFPLPSLPVQRRIVAYLDDLQARMDALKRLQAESAAGLEALLPSVLDRAFRGEL